LAEKILEELSKAIIEGDGEAAKKAAEDGIEAKVSALDAIMEMQKAMGVVGQKFEAKEYFLSELITAGTAMKAAMEVIEPHIKPGEVAVSGKVSLEQ